MSRLIDADALLDELDNREYSREKHDFKILINNQPTAYDVEKVVVELGTHKAQYGKLQLAHNDANMVCVYVGKEQAIDCAIDIVKRGGVE